MQEFRNNIRISKSWWRLLGVMIVVGVFFTTILIGYGVVYLYNHLQWVP